MRRILIAGRIKGDDVSDSARFLECLRRVDAVGAIGAVRCEADAEEYAEAFDALLLSGGMDMDPARYDQEPHPANTYDGPERDLSDELLFEAFYARGKRILGICRGCQVVNVFLGGTLHQHLPDVYDPVLWHGRNMYGRHTVSVNDMSRLGKLLGLAIDPAVGVKVWTNDIHVNSSHHQAIDILGEGLKDCAVAADGVLEAAEGENILLIQWHPEYMGSEHDALFRWLADT